MTDQYKCQRCNHDDNVLQDCTCRKCGDTIEERARKIAEEIVVQVRNHGNHISTKTVAYEVSKQALQQTREDTIREVVELVNELKGFTTIFGNSQAHWYVEADELLTHLK